MTGPGATSARPPEAAAPTTADVPSPFPPSRGDHVPLTRSHIRATAEAYLARHPHERESLAGLLSLLDAADDPTDRAKRDNRCYVFGSAMTRPELTGCSSLTRISRFPAQRSSRSQAQAGSYAAVGSWGTRLRPVSSRR